MRHIDHAIYASVHNAPAVAFRSSANIRAGTHIDSVGLMDSLQTRFGMLPFVIYRLALGAVLFIDTR
jgi:hypothetical protein